jgi:hypothetical protein
VTPDEARVDRWAAALAGAAGSRAFTTPATATEWDHLRNEWRDRARTAIHLADQEQHMTNPAEHRLALAHQARRAKEHQLDDVRRALCDTGIIRDDDPYSHADLADVIRQTAAPKPAEPAHTCLFNPERVKRWPAFPVTDDFAEDQAVRQRYAAARDREATEGDPR